jgi:hypothetical protein
MKFGVILMLFAAIAVLSLHAAPTISVKDVNGNTLKIRPLSCDAKTLTFVRVKDRKKFTVDLERFDDESRKKIEDWKAEGGHLSSEFEVDVFTGKSAKASGKEDFDDKCVNIDPVVTVKNPDLNRKAKPGKVTVVFLGRPVLNRGGMFVFCSETHDLPSLEGGGSSEFKMKKIYQNYDDRGSAQFGARYLGYVVIIHDPETNEIYHKKSVPTTIAEKYGPLLLKLSPGKVYEDKVGLRELGRL